MPEFEVITKDEYMPVLYINAESKDEAKQIAIAKLQAAKDKRLDDAIAEVRAAREYDEAQKQKQHSKQQPATAYDYRRVIALVQVLAMDIPSEAKMSYLYRLAESWIIKEKYGREIDHIPEEDIVEALAQAALEAARDERE